MSIFSKIDFLGVPATLNFFGNSKRKSNFGGICSVLLLGFMVWAIYNASLDMVNRTNPKLTLSEINVEDPKELDISLDKFPIAFIIQKPTALGSAGFTNASIYTVEVKHSRTERIKQPDGSVIKVTTDTPLEVEKCTKEYFGAYASSFKTFTFKGSYCLKRNQPGLEKLKVQGIYSSTVYQILAATVKQCIPSTNVTCGTDQEIRQALSGAFFSAMYLDTNGNYQNYHNPTAKYRELYPTLMNPLSYKEVNIDIGLLEITTDSGLFTETSEIESTLKVSKIAEIVDLNPSPDKILMYCYFQAARMETYYTRTYKKIPTVLAEVGGMCNVFLAIVLILISPYLRLKSKEALMNELFDFGGQSESQRKNKINTRVPKRRSRRDLSSPFHTNILSEPEPILQKATTNQTYGNEIHIPRIALSPRIKSVSDVFIPSEARSQDSPRSPERPVVTQLKTDQNEDIQPYLLSFPSPRAFSVTSRVNSTRRKLIQEAPNSYRLRKANGDESGEFEDDIEKQLKHIDLEVKEEINVKDNEGEKVKIEIPELQESERNKEQEKGEGEASPVDKGRNSQLTPKSNMNNPTLGFSKAELNVWEYVLSFIYKPKRLKTKIEIIEEGVKNIEERLDVNNILKKFCEVDKLIALLLDRDQLELFNNMPKPQLQKVRRNSMFERKSTYEENLSKKITRIQFAQNEDYVQDSYERIREKISKSDIDKRLVAIFKEKFD